MLLFVVSGHRFTCYNEKGFIFFKLFLDMRVFAGTLLVLFNIQLVAQIQMDKSSHDFGRLYAESIRYVDLIISNQGTRSFKIFSVRKSKEVSSLLSQKTVNAGENSTLRLQVNPSQLGPFEYKVEVFSSDKNDASIITLTGEVEAFDPSNVARFASCPSFASIPAGGSTSNPNTFYLNLTVVDTLTRTAVTNAQIRLIQKGVDQWTLPTNKEGKLKKKADLGISYFQVSHPDYETKEFASYINFKRNNIEVRLFPDTSAGPEPEITVLDGVFKSTPSTSPSSKDTAEMQKEETVLDLANIDKDNFSSDYFDPVNVVFILDVSSSMRHADKLELMQYSLMQLLEMLRPEDQFGIVSYASNSEVLLPPTSGENKDQIKEIIQGLEAKGFTSGSKGIEMGYKTALNAKIKNGLNQVIIITDGSFNKDEKGYKRLLKKYLRKGISLSVVGIKTNPKAEEEMTYIAKTGGGNYIPIRNLSDAENQLKAEIRSRSFKNKTKKR